MVKITGIEIIDNKYLQIDMAQHPDLVKPILEKMSSNDAVAIDEEYFDAHWGKGYTPDEFFAKLTNSIRKKFNDKTNLNDSNIK